MTPEEHIRILQRRIKNQRAELKRLNKYLGPYWQGFSRGISMEAECRLRGIMNATFGHEKVRAAEVAAADRRSKAAVVEPGETPKPGFFQRLIDAL